MSSNQRPTVYFSRDTNGTQFQKVPFEKCVLTSMGCSGDRMRVGFSYRNSQLEIYPSPNGVMLQHHPGCSCRFLTASDITCISKEALAGGLSVGVCLLLQSLDGKVLITRRSKQLDIFPSIWVLPGGHVEQGETLQQAAAREFTEETGLKTPDNEDFETLGLWESNFPTLLSHGVPKRHHIVVYFLLHVNHDHTTLQEHLRFNPAEVDAAVWLDQFVVGDIAKSSDYGKNIQTPQKNVSAIVLENNQYISRRVPLSTFMTSLPPPSEPDVERISAGTKFAFRQWLKLLYPPAPGSLQKADSLETVFHMLTKAGHQPNPSPFWAR